LPTVLFRVLIEEQGVVYHSLSMERVAINASNGLEKKVQQRIILPGYKNLVSNQRIHLVI